MTIPREVRQALRERSSGDPDYGVCEICGKPATNAHHRKNKSQGGKDVLSNLLMLCGSGTTGCHGFITRHPKTASLHGWTVWSYEDPATKPVSLSPQRVLLDDEGGVVPSERNESEDA